MHRITLRIGVAVVVAMFVACAGAGPRLVGSADGVVTAGSVSSEPGAETYLDGLPVDRSMGPIVATTAGAVQGLQRPGTQAYLGIPFAAPPIGVRRFMPPLPPVPWDGVRSAQQFAPACVQAADTDPVDARLGIVQALEVQSEDCLNANVYTPSADGKRRPVMVFIHGGSNDSDSARDPAYDGSALAKRENVVVVTFDYRVGIFGFTLLSQLDPTLTDGNAGLLDQEAALKWVQGNIDRFGGDPHNVTVFGESAGGGDLQLLLDAPSANGLFQKAIIESGAMFPLVSVTEAQASTRQMLAAVGAKTLAQLQEVGARTLERKSDAAGISVWPSRGGSFASGYNWSSVRDLAGKVPLLIGTNADESRYFTVVNAPPGRSIKSQTAALWRQTFGNARMMKRLFGSAAGRVIAFYRERYPNEFNAINAFLTQGGFREPALRFAQVHAAVAPTYVYDFGYQSPVRNLDGLPYGAAHAMELSFVFGDSSIFAQAFAGPSSRWGDLEDVMMDAWGAFARTGNPSTTSHPWPMYVGRRQAVMVFGSDRSGVSVNPWADERVLWRRVPSRLLPIPGG